MKKHLLLILCITIISCNKTEKTNEINENQKVIEYIESEMKEQGIPAVQISVIKDKKVVLSKTLGIANVPFSVKADENTIFSINSIGKIFTSTAIMQLAEQGKLKLADKISNHLDSLPKDWNDVSIKQLLSHTSGLPDIEDPITEKLIGNKGMKVAWEMVKKLPIKIKPGEKFGYNATNYILLYKLIEKCSGIPYQDFVKKYQFDIAGMKRVFFQNSFDVIVNKSPTYSYYYQNKETGEYDKREELYELYEEYPKELTTDSGVFTSTKEISKWIIALLNGKFFKDNNSIETMWQPVKLNNGTYDGFGDALNAYALGWPVVQRENHPAVAPLGGGRACLFIYPNDSLSIIVNTNLMGSFPHEIVDNISKIYFREQTEINKN